MISTITQSVLAKPDTSCRRNRSPKTVISNQNHSTKINIEKTSARKLGKVKPPGNNMSVLPILWFGACRTEDFALPDCERRVSVPEARWENQAVGLLVES